MPRNGDNAGESGDSVKEGLVSPFEHIEVGIILFSEILFEGTITLFDALFKGRNGDIEIDNEIGIGSNRFHNIKGTKVELIEWKGDISELIIKEGKDGISVGGTVSDRAFNFLSSDLSGSRSFEFKSDSEHLNLHREGEGLWVLIEVMK